MPGAQRAGRGSAPDSPGRRRYRLAREQRLLNAAQFGLVFRHRCQSRDGGFAVYGRRNGLDLARLGLAVSRRVSRSAVVRNRIKRQIREAFRHEAPGLAGLDVVVVAHTAAAGMTNEELRAAIQRHWQRVTAKCRS
jgi:ribonuclease P protein component